MSISRSVSEVETAVLEGPQLEEMIARAPSGKSGAKPATAAVKVKEEEKPLRKFRKGTGVEASSRPSTVKPDTNQGKVKTSVLNGEKEDGAKTEVATCARMDTPSGVGVAVGTRFTFPRHENGEMSDEDEPSDHGESDGEGGAIPRVIPERHTLRPLTAPVTKRGITHDGESRRPLPPITSQESGRTNIGKKKRGKDSQSKATWGKRKVKP